MENVTNMFGMYEEGNSVNLVLELLDLNLYEYLTMKNEVGALENELGADTGIGLIFDFNFLFPISRPF